MKTGKLYVVELPDEEDFIGLPDEDDFVPTHKGRLEEEYETAYSKAITNKVEVKNREVIVKGGTHGILFTLDNKQLLDNETFPLPEVEIKHEWPNPCIPHKYCLENYELKKESCKTNCVREKLVSTAILKRIEPETIFDKALKQVPESVKEEVDKQFDELNLMWELTIAYENLKNSDKLAIPELVKLYTIQRKKS